MNRRGRSVIALGVAATIGLVIPFGRTWLRPTRPTDEVGPYLRQLAPLSLSLRTGSRVGIAIETDWQVSGKDVMHWYRAQYALAPAFVRPILLSDCLSRGPSGCGAEQLDFLVAGAAQRDSLALAEEFGFTFARSSGGVLLLTREKP